MDSVARSLHDVCRGTSIAYSMMRRSMIYAWWSGRWLTFGQGPLWGKIFDRYGPRYLLLAGTILHVFGLMMASLGYGPFDKRTVERPTK